jgi:hypothetical protein
MFLLYRHTAELLNVLRGKGEDLFTEPSSEHSGRSTKKGEKKIRKYLAAEPQLLITDDPASVVN